MPKPLRPVLPTSTVRLQLSTTPAAVAQPPAQLWLCLLMPQLALDAILLDNSDVCGVVTHQHKARIEVVMASAAAQATGIVAGMPLSAACALSPQLQVWQREPSAEQSRLQAIAEWAVGFSACVSLVAEDAVLLEVQGSARLYGGMNALLRRIKQAYAQTWGGALRFAVAPTPLASELLARCGESQTVTQLALLRSALANVSIPAASQVLKLNKTQLKQLAGMGFDTLQQLWRLPRQGLARRLGQEVLLTLDRVLGNSPHPLTFIKPQESFEASIALPLEVTQHIFIFSALQRLLKKLVIFLRQRDACVASLQVLLHHGRDQEATRVEINLRQPCRDLQRFCLLADERLQAIPLFAVVYEVTLCTGRLQRYRVNPASLFDHLPGGGVDDEQRDENWQDTLEQLQSRLGEQAVQKLSVCAEHRPELAWQYSVEVVESQPLPQQPRPFWLLPCPELLRHDHKLIFLRGPERIESGWWQGKAMRRDYYVVRNAEGECWWIYRDLARTGRDASDATGNWYLHGLFA